MPTPEKKCVVTCALTGVLTNPMQHTFLPVTPQEMAKEAKRAADQGATVVHCHFRDQREGMGFLPTWDADIVAQIVDAIKAAVPEIIINMSTGVPGNDISGPLACIERIKPDIAAMNAGSLNYLKLKKDGTWAWPPMLFDNPVDKIQKYLDTMYANGVTPECECFDTGIVRSLSLFEKAGMLMPPVHASFVMGVASGQPADPELLPILVKYLPEGAQFQTITVGRTEVWEVHRKAAEMGGHVRTGLEDTFYDPKGEKVNSNGALIEALVAIVRETGREIADFSEARALMVNS